MHCFFKLSTSFRYTMTAEKKKEKPNTGQENLDQGSEQMLLRDVSLNTFSLLVYLQVASCMRKDLIIIALKYFQFSKIIFMYCKTFTLKAWAPSLNI